MGNLINPLSRILGYKRNLFWGNNFSFYYFNNDVYRQKIFKIKIFKRIFKFIFRFLFDFLKFPRVYYSLTLNFIGQANQILFIKCNVRNIHMYNIASLLMMIKYVPLPDLAPKYNFNFGIFSLKSRLKFTISFIQARYVKIFRKWRMHLLNLYLQKLKKKKEIMLYSPKNERSSYVRRLSKMKALINYFKFFEINKRENKNLSNWYNFDKLKVYFRLKFKMAAVNILLLQSMCCRFFIDLFTMFFKMFAQRIIYNFGVRHIKLTFKKKKPTAASLVRNVNSFCYLALRRGYRINYVIKIVRYAVRFLRNVRGFQMIVTGRFYRRGKAMNKISTWGEVGSQTGKGFLIYKNYERVKEYGMCSVKLMFFFRRKLQLSQKIPLRNKWFNYLKFLRSNTKLRHEFGYIRY